MATYKLNELVKGQQHTILEEQSFEECFVFMQDLPKEQTYCITRNGKIVNFRNAEEPHLANFF